MNSPSPGLKISLALSGGGFRATLFHLGVVRFLHDAGILKKVGRVAAVSGGSILAAHLGLNWKRYTTSDEEFEIAAQEIIKFIREDVRGRVVRRWIFAWLTLVPRLLKPKRWTFTNLLQVYYRRLYSGARLGDLVKLQDEGAPEIFLNCASLGTGTACAFGGSKFWWLNKKGEEQSILAPNTRVDFAVAASSAFPPLFPPIAISSEVLSCDPDQFPNPFYLTDGGIYDNLGVDRIVRLQKETADTSLIIASNAEGNFSSEFDKRYTFLISRNVRASNFLMSRVSTQTIEDLAKLNASIVWVRIKDEVVGANGASYLPSEFQRKMSSVRTDLDEFLPEEITALISHGYAKARSALIASGAVASDAPTFSWDPLGNWIIFNQSAAFEKLAAKLDEAGRRRWRLWSARDGISWATAVILAIYSVLAVVAVPAALIAIAQAFPTVLPFWAPFDANIAIRNIRVANVSPLEAKPDSSSAEVQIEFVESKIGPSTLRDCVPELKLKDVFRPRPERPQVLAQETQAVVELLT